jgi:hypothetical protein
MAVSKFLVACAAAALCGATAGFAADPFAPPVRETVRPAPAATPVSQIGRPNETFRGVTVRSASGRTLGRVVGVETGSDGRATGVKVALTDGGRTVWLDRGLAYSRSGDVLIAPDRQGLAVADAR